MTIKDLFSKSKVAVVESSESGSVDLESPTFLDTVIKDNSTFVPFLDFYDPNLFVKFGSAELYYDSAIKRIYQTYPYDGSENEKLQFQLSSSYLEEWLYYNKYPRSTGYAIFSANGFGAQSSTADGYGLPASLEYIDAAGGLHTASAGMQTGKLFENFDKSIKYDPNKNRTQNFRLMPTEGNTVEFWLKKDAFDVSKTEKEVILDLWNTEGTSSSDYGRLTIYLTGSGVGDSGANPIRVTLRNGSQGFNDQSVASSTFTTSSLTDSSWHHYAISFVSQSTSIKTFFYVDGVLENELNVGSFGIDEISGRVNARIGALKTRPDGSSALAGAGKLSASMDEFRFWKTRRTSKLINQNWFQPIAGGSNTEDNNASLGCYYKFNEGITATNSIDATVLDYSGRLTNGTWTGYSAAARNTGSCFVSASVIAIEEPDPIIRSTHPDVVTLSTEMATSGSDYDTKNTTYLFQKLPQFIQDDDIDNDDDVKKLFQIISSYFDTIYAQTKVLPELTQKNYFSSSMKPLPFANKLLESRGFITRELFVDTEVLEFYRGNDLQNLKYGENVNNIKNQIYHNIYNNLDYILKSKGTEKSMRNFLRCFGIDDELVKLNLYTDEGTHYFTDVYKNTSVTKKYLNFNNPDYFSSTVYQTSSVNNPNVYISGSGMSGAEERLERFNAFTFEIDTIIPEKIDITDDGFFDTMFLSSSIGGFHQPAVETEGRQYHWSSEDNIANIQIYTVKDKTNSERAKFLITNEDGTVFLTSSFYPDIYSNNRWNLSVRVAPDGYGVYGSALSSSNPNYKLTFYGLNHQFGEVREEFKLTASLNNTSGSAYVCNPKTVYAGAHYENYTGSLLQESDVQIGGCRYWFDFLEDADLKAHSLDVTSIGVDNATRCGTMFTYIMSGTVLPRADMLALNWDFDTVTGSNSSGNFDVFDLTSGSTLQNIGAVGSAAFGSNPSNTQTITISDGTTSVVFTFVGSPTGADNEVEIEAGVNATIDSLADVINANAFNVSAISNNLGTITLANTDSSSGASGNITITTTTSATVSGMSGGITGVALNGVYGWLDNIVERDHPAVGANFGASKTSFVENELIYTAKKELPEISVSSENIHIKGDFEKFFVKDDDVSDNFYSLEKSMYQVISDEMLSMFASAVEFNNLMGEAVDRYRHRYKNLDKMRQLFFEKVESDMDFDKFTNYYKWIDSAISEMMTQLFPFSARHSEGIADIVESHILERNKYQNKFPLTTRLASTEGSARGVGELTYNWKFGHAPLGGTQPTAVITIAANPTAGDTLTFGDGVSDSKIYEFVTTVTDADTQILIGGAPSLPPHDAITRTRTKTKLESDFDVSITIDGNDLQITNNLIIQRARGNFSISETFTDASNIVSGFSGGADILNENCLWNKERKERILLSGSSDDQIILNSILNHNSASAPLLAKDDGTMYFGSTYAINRLSKPYKESIAFNDTIHGGTNYSKIKDRDFVYTATQIHGPVTKESPRGIPQNVMVVGVGEGQGTDAFIDCKDVEDPNEKRKWRFTAVVGRFAEGQVPQARQGEDYTHKVKSEAYWPSNLISGNVQGGYADLVTTKFKSGSIITNLHSDTFSPSNEIGLQSPFTNAWVGGHQSRHVDLNKFDTSLKSEGGTATVNNIDDQYSRPEAWRLLLKECADNSGSKGTLSGSNDGAMGFVGPDYGGPYPDKSRKYAFRYREERTKRPVNLKNIKTTTGSAVLGNYKENYEVVHTFGMKGNSPVLKEATGSLLPDYHSTQLPASTHYQTLIGISPFLSGNVFGQPDTLQKTGNNRQSNASSQLIKAGVPGAVASVGLAFKMPPHNVVGTGSTLTVPTTGSGITIAIDADGSDLRVNTDGSDANFRTNLASALTDVTLYDNTKTTTEGGDTDTSLQIKSPLGTNSNLPNFVVNDPNNLIEAMNTDSFYWAGWVWTPRTAGGIGRFLWSLGSGFYKCSVSLDSSLAGLSINHNLFNGSLRSWVYDGSFNAQYADSWTHLAVAFNSSSLIQEDSVTLYINGVSSSLRIPTLGGAFYSSSFGTTFGILQNGSSGTSINVSQQWSGSVSNWVFGTGSLSSTDVLKLYNHGYVWDTEYSASEIAAHWKFGGTGSFGTDELIAPGGKFFNHLSANNYITSSNKIKPDQTTFETTAPDETANLKTPTIATFSLTASLENSNYNGAITSAGPTIYLNGVEHSDPFFSLGTLSGGVTPVAEVARRGIVNVIPSQRDDLTSSNSIIRTRFSAPGGPEINTRGYLDIGSQEFSVYNAMPFRNLSVRGSGSGEAATIRVNSQASRREGLRTLLTRHSGRYGIDSQFGAIQEDSYVVGDASFEKTNRNTRVIPDLSSSALQRKNHDNGFVTRPIPSQDYGYSWVTSSLNHALAPSTVRKVTSTATITIAANPSADDTVTVGDGVTTVIFTFKASAGSATEVTIGADNDATRANLKTKMATQFPNMIIQDQTVLNRLLLTNSVSGTLGNFTLSETMGGSPSNIVTGFSGGEDIAQQLAFGFWPVKGIISASADVNWRNNGFDSAVNFPTASFGNGLVGVYS